jgi:hypothetical protein
LRQQRLSDQLSDDRRARPRTPTDVHGQDVRLDASPAAGQGDVYLASGRRGRGFKSRHPDQGSCRSVPDSLICPGRSPYLDVRFWERNGSRS